MDLVDHVAWGGFQPTQRNVIARSHVLRRAVQLNRSSRVIMLKDMGSSGRCATSSVEFR